MTLKKILISIVLLCTGITALFIFSGANFKKRKALIAYSHRVDNLIQKYSNKELLKLQHEETNDYNIILVLTDDQHYETWKHMPYLKSLTEEKGILFPQAFATNPTCCPFRASLISGGFDSHETGVKSLSRPNGTLYNLDENRTIPVYLQSMGIKTGFVGKYMHGYHPGYVPPGWDSFVANEDGGMIRDYWNLYNITYGKSDASASKGDVRYSLFPKKQYITNFQTNAALKFIDNNKNQRFFLFLSYYAAL